MAMTPPESDPESASTVRSDGGSKKAYEAPRLTDYGPISKLTQTGGITNRDFSTMKQVCL